MLSTITDKPVEIDQLADILGISVGHETQVLGYERKKRQHRHLAAAFLHMRPEALCDDDDDDDDDEEETSCTNTSAMQTISSL